MKKNVLFLFFFGIGFFSNAQSSLPKNVNDSLWGIWKNESLEDTIRLATLNKIIWDGYLFSQPDSAIFFAGQMHQFAVEHEEVMYIGLGLSNKGTAYYIKGDYKNASIFYNEGLVVYKQINHHTHITATLSKIGNIYKNTGDYSRALEYYNESYSIDKEHQNKEGMATTLNNMGAVYMYQSDFPAAMNYFMKSYQYAVEVDDKKAIANASGNIGIVYRNLGDYDKALEFYFVGLKIQEEIGDKKGIANSLNNLAAVYKIQADYTGAIETFRRCVNMYDLAGNKQGSALANCNIGIVYSALGIIDSALFYCKQGLNVLEEIGDKRGVANAVTNISYLYEKQDDIISALLFAQKGLNMANELGLRHEAKLATRALYQFNLINKDLGAAAEYVYKLKSLILGAIEKNYFILTEREKELYFVAMEEDFMRYYDFTSIYQEVQPAIADTAYNLALTNKGLALKSSTAMRQTIVNSGDSVLIQQYEEWRLLKQKISKLYASGKDTKELEEQASAIEKILVKKSNAFSDFEKIKNLDWKQVQSGLKTGDAAIEFVHFLDETEGTLKITYAAIIVRKESEHPIMVKLCKEDELIQILGTFQGNNLNFINTVYGTKNEARTALYDKVWKPLEIHLSGIKNIFLSPTGLLHKISFAAISNNTNEFLCDKYDIQHLSSTGHVAYPENSEILESDVFTLIGGVKYSSESTQKEIWEYLPGTLKETDNISTYLRKRNLACNYYSGELANEQTFKTNAGQSNILHIATHGYFFADPDKIDQAFTAETIEETDLVFRGANSNYAAWNFVKNKNPLMRSGIILANSNDVWDRDPLQEGEDGILTAAEVSNMDLQNTKLVVLSACETGLGDIKGSEGVYGLQRAFKMAGVKFIIMSLWQVPDKETAEFMTLFYKRLIKLKDIHLAFNQTQKAMRAKYDPYYWAAFVLIE